MDVNVLLQYGAIGAVLVAFGFFARTLVVREQERADRCEAELKKRKSQQ